MHMPDTKKQRKAPALKGAPRKLSGERSAERPKRTKDESVAVPESDFSKRLTSLRESKGLRHDSLSELSKLVDPQRRGIARTTLRGYEWGIYKPGIRELRILSQALGVSPTLLIFGADDSSITSSPRPSVVASTVESDLATRSGIKRELLLAWAAFAMTMFSVDERTRETIFRIAAELAEANLGAVEYQRIVGMAREVMDTSLDRYLDSLPGPGSALGLEFMKMLIDPQTIKQGDEIVGAILTKFGFKAQSPATARVPPYPSAGSKKNE